MEQNLVTLQISDIFSNPTQGRTQFDPVSMKELSASIKENGLLQPLLVRFTGSQYQLIAGERRLQACKMANLEEIPCLIMEADDKQTAIFSLIENMQRKDLHYFEQATAIFHLTESLDMTQEQVAQKLGKSQPTVANKLRLLQYTNKEREIFLQNQLTERHARALLRVRNPLKRFEMLCQVVQKKLNVVQTEALIEEKMAPPKEKAKRIMVVKDLRIFLNTINKAIDVMHMAGISAKINKKESDDFIEYKIQIPTKIAHKEKNKENTSAS